MKKNMIKRTLTVSLASLVAASALPFNLLTASAAQGGSCGDGVYWSYDPSGELTIAGNGVMDNYLHHMRPWQKLSNAVTKITIADGVTNISAVAFYDFTALTTVTIPDSVEMIGLNAFRDSTNLEYVYMTPTDRVIIDGAFAGTKYAETYLTTEELSYMNYGSAREMRGKQVVVNIFLDELSIGLPSLDSADGRAEWTKITGDEELDFDSYDLDKYYYDSYHDATETYRIEKNKLAFQNYTSAWQQGYKAVNDETAMAVSLNPTNYPAYVKSDTSVLPQNEGFYGTYVRSDKMEEHSIRLNTALTKLEESARSYGINDLDFITEPSLNFHFTYNTWDDGTREAIGRDGVTYQHRLNDTHPSIIPTQDNALMPSSSDKSSPLSGKGSGTRNVFEQIYNATNGEIDLLKADDAEMSPYAQKVKDMYNADGVIVLVHLDECYWGRSYAIQTMKEKQSNGEEFVMLYNNSIDTIMHEICHVYGAKDYYDDGLKNSNVNGKITSGSPTFKMYCDTYFRNCPDMMTDNTNKFNALTAYTLGWIDSVEKDVFDQMNGATPYYLGDIDMDGTVGIPDRKLLGAYYNGDAFLTPMQRVLAGEGLSTSQTIKAWTNHISAKRIENQPQYVQFQGDDTSKYMYTIENDMNFDGVFNSKDTALYDAFVTGTQTPSYLQELAMQYVSDEHRAVKYSTVLSEWEDRIAAEMRKFPDGEYWNAMEENGSEDGTTSVPCDHSKNKKEYCLSLDHKLSMTSASINESRVWHSRYDCSHSIDPKGNFNCTIGKYPQCCGFARKVAEDIWGTESFVRYYIEDGMITPTADSKPEEYVPQVGDQIRLYSDGSELESDPNAPAAGHSLFIASINGDDITVAECNGDMNTCQIRWTDTVYKYKVLADNSVTTDGEVKVTADFLRENAVFVERPVLQGDFDLDGKIDSDDYDFFKSSFLVNGTTPANYSDKEFDVNGDFVLDEKDEAALQAFMKQSTADGYILNKNVTIKYQYRSLVGGNDFIVDNGMYTILSKEDKTVAFTGVFDKNVTSYVIPEAVKAEDGKVYTVVQMNTECRGARNSMYGKMKSVVIPATVTSIEGYAFGSGCNLTSITFAPNSRLKTIKNGAFSGCDKLVSISLPHTVETIENYAFSGCTSLKIFRIEGKDGSCNLTTAGDNVFDKCENLSTPILPKTPNLKTPGCFAPTVNGSKDEEVYGDLNDDKELTVLDVIALQKYLKSTTATAAPKNADFCIDGRIDAFDLAVLMKMILKR